MEEQASNSWYCTCVLMLYITVAGYTTSMPLTSLNPVTPVIQMVYNNTYMNRFGEPMDENSWTSLLSLTMSMLFVGAFVSSLFMKFLLDKLTRKQLMVLMHVVNVIGHAVIAIGGRVWGSYEAFITGRFIIGMSIGVVIGLTGIIVSELCVPHRRLFYGAVLGTSYPIGATFGAIVAWPKVLGSPNLWVGVIALGCLMSIIYIAVAYWTPDTPFQVMLSTGSEDTMKLLEKLRCGSKEELLREIQTLGRGNEKNKKTQEADEATLWEVLKAPHYRKHFFGVVIVFSYIMSSGMSNILFFSDRIFMSAGLGRDVVTPATIGVLVMGVIVSLASIIILAKFDPKPVLLVGSVIMIVGDAFLTASLATYIKVPAMSICSIVAMGLFFIGFSAINAAAFAVIGVLCVDRTRSACMFVATMFFWIFAFFVAFISPYFAVWLGPYAFLVWMGVAIIVTIYIALCMPKTKGKTENEIQEYYKK